jgi:hypothetical protein
MNNIFIDKIEEDLANALETDIYLNEIIPKFVFIVPYRDRLFHQTFFSKHMKEILEDYQPSEYKIYYIHQCNNHSFNRGAMKNIGFLMIKEKYPFHYKNITLVFNDVDVMPIQKNLINYETTNGVLKHFYGYSYGLGGIVSIKAIDFEKTQGFPNYWTWGYEDNLFKERVINKNIIIDKSQFYNAFDEHMIELHHGVYRETNKNEFAKFIGKVNEGYNTIYDLKYKINESTGFVNVYSFQTGYLDNIQQNKTYNLNNGNTPFKGSISTAMSMSFF